MRVREPTHGRELTHGAQMHGTAVEAHVRQRQGRLERAAAQEAPAQGQHLHKRLGRSMAATRKARRQGPQEPSGQPTPGRARGGDTPTTAGRGGRLVSASKATAPSRSHGAPAPHGAGANAREASRPRRSA